MSPRNLHRNSNAKDCSQSCWMCSLTTERLCKMLPLQKLNNMYKVKGATFKNPIWHACLQHCHIRKAGVWSQCWLPGVIPLFFLLHLWITVMSAFLSQRNHSDLGKLKEICWEPPCTCLSAALEEYINIHLWTFLREGLS